MCETCVASREHGTVAAAAKERLARYVMNFGAELAIRPHLELPPCRARPDLIRPRTGVRTARRDSSTTV
jgi:hypothetical protein